MNQHDALGQETARREPRKAFRGLQCFLFWMIFVLLFLAVSPVFDDKSGRSSVINLYQEPKDSLDVVFLGTSHMVCAIYPMDLWKEYGIASTNYAHNGQAFALTYYSLKEAIEQQHPKLAVVDLYYIYKKEKTGSAAYMHQTIDNYRPSLTKLQAIWDIVPLKQKLEFVLPFSLYHSRWKELRKSDFLPTSSPTKGANEIFEAPEESFDPFMPIDRGDILEPHPIMQTYLKKMVELCKQTNTQLLFTVVPYYPQGEQQDRVLEDDQRMFNWVESFAKGQGVGFLNYLYLLDELGFDHNTDMREWNHANYFGGMKVTHHMGAYIREHYGIPDHREDAAYAHWAKDLRTYENYVKKNKK